MTEIKDRVVYDCVYKAFEIDPKEDLPLAPVAIRPKLRKSDNDANIWRVEWENTGRGRSFKVIGLLFDSVSVVKGDEISLPKDPPNEIVITAEIEGKPETIKLQKLTKELFDGFDTSGLKDKLGTTEAVQEYHLTQF